MRNKRRLLVGVVLLLLASQLQGCAYSYHFRTELPPSNEKHNVWLHQGAWGHAGNNVVNLEELCPGGVAEFGSRITILNWFPALLTVGLYAPRTAFAICAAGGGAR